MEEEIRKKNQEMKELKREMNNSTAIMSMWDFFVTVQKLPRG